MKTWTKFSTWLLFTVTLLTIPSVGLAAQNVYVRIDGDTQGWIQGDSTVQGREDLIEGSAYHHLMEIPSGGTAINHQTVILTKPFDKSNVPLLRAMDNNEMMTVVFRFFRPSGGGGEEEYYKITLRRARVVSMEPLSPDAEMPDTSSLPPSERVRFSYDDIEVTWLPTGDTHTANGK